MAEYNVTVVNVKAAKKRVREKEKEREKGKYDNHKNLLFS
jgi:hypothetical protein